MPKHSVSRLHNSVGTLFQIATTPGFLDGFSKGDIQRLTEEIEEIIEDLVLASNPKFRKIVAECVVGLGLPLPGPEMKY